MLQNRLKSELSAGWSLSRQLYTFQNIRRYMDRMHEKGSKYHMMPFSIVKLSVIVVNRGSSSTGIFEYEYTFLMLRHVRFIVILTYSIFSSGCNGSLQHFTRILPEQAFHLDNKHYSSLILEDVLIWTVLPFTEFNKRKGDMKWFCCLKAYFSDRNNIKRDIQGNTGQIDLTALIDYIILGWRSTIIIRQESMAVIEELMLSLESSSHQTSDWQSFPYKLKQHLIQDEKRINNAKSDLISVNGNSLRTQEEAQKLEKAVIQIKDDCSMLRQRCDRSFDDLLSTMAISDSHDSI